MKRNLRIAAALLTGLTAISCGSTAPSEDTTTAPTGETTTAAETEPERSHGIPESVDFGGREFTIAYPDWSGYSFYFAADEENGDVMNDALYSRTRAVEEYLNVDLIHDLRPNSESVTATVQTQVTAGESSIQMGLIHCIQGVSTLSSGGYLYNLDDLEYVNMDADWWNQKQMDMLRMGKNTYYAINDYMIPSPYVIYFNKDMIERYKLDNPYELVYDQKWTLDRFKTMSKTVTSDVNGDGNWDINDQYGISTNEVSKYTSFMTGANQYITKKGDDGRVELAMNTEKTFSLVETFADLANSNTIYLPANEDNLLTIDSDRLLFQLGWIAQASGVMRDYKVDFGFLPYPKFDENQEDYVSLDWGGLCCVPVNAGDADFIGAVMELLAFESGNKVIPTYYDVVLSGKIARDADSKNMLDILHDTITYDVGMNYFGFSSGFGNMVFTIGRLPVTNKSTDFASWYESNSAPAESAIESFYEALESVENQ